MGRRQCELDGCTKRAESGGTPHCKAHGGGRRCQEEGCTKSARGSTQRCKAHGGGKRCRQDGCSKPVAQAPGSVYCRLCLRAAQPQPDGAESLPPSAPTEREAIRTRWLLHLQGGG